MISAQSSDISAAKTAQRVNILTLFTSGSTLICCALPAALVAIGSAATLTTLVSNFPQLIWISEHKPPVFGLAGFMLLVAGYFQWNARFLPCPTEPALAAQCTRLRKRASVIYWVSVAIFFTGVFFAFIAPFLI